jgi:WD40 repeat protein
VTHVAVSNDGKCLLASCLDSKVRLLETDTGELLNAYSGHHATSMRAEARLSHDDACVLSTSEDGHVVAWDIVQAVMLRQFKVRAATCFAVPSHFIRFFCVCARRPAPPQMEHSFNFCQCVTVIETGVLNSSHIY